MSVELRGFEPLTPCMPCKCSARLSYSPKEWPGLYQASAAADSTSVRGASAQRRSSS